MALVLHIRIRKIFVKNIYIIMLNIYQKGVIKIKSGNIYLILLVIILITFLGGNLISEQKVFNEDECFKLIFWDNSINDRIEDMERLSYNELMSNYKHLHIISSKYIKKYYWDEQVIEVDIERFCKDNNGFSFKWIDFGFFTCILNNKIIYHGLNRTSIIPNILPYDDSSYPAIQSGKSSKKVIFFLLKPRFKPIFMTFKDYDKKERQKIINQDVYNYFAAQGKIVNGYYDLEKLCGFEKGVKLFLQ